MSAINNNTPNRNKDFDGNDKGNTSNEIWSDGYLEDKIFNKIMEFSKKYTQQAVTTFHYFRLNSPSAIFEFDIADFDKQIITQLERKIIDLKNNEGKYLRLISIFTKVANLIYIHNTPKILAESKEDPTIIKRAINDIHVKLCYKWKLTDTNHGLPNSSSLQGLIGYSSSESSVLSINKDQNNENQEKSNTNKNKNENKTQNQDNETLKLLTIAEGRCIEKFKDQINRFYVTLQINDHVGCRELHSSSFKNIIRREYFDIEQKPLSDDRLDGIMQLIEAGLMLNEDIKIIDLKLRVAKTENDVYYYDLTNLKWEIIKITFEGWNMIKNDGTPIFKR